MPGDQVQVALRNGEIEPTLAMGESYSYAYQRIMHAGTLSIVNLSWIGNKNVQELRGPPNALIRELRHFLRAQF